MTNAPSKSATGLQWLTIAGLIFGGSAVGYLLNPPLVGTLIGFGAGSVLSLAFVSWSQQRIARSMSSETDTSGRSRANARFVAALMAWMAVYIAVVVTISWIVDIDTWPYWARVMAAIAPALPIGGVIVALLKYLATEPDEFQRMLVTRAVLLAMGITFFVVTAWGFLELYVNAPHFPNGLIMACFWAAFGATNSWVRWQNR